MLIPTQRFGYLSILYARTRCCLRESLPFISHLFCASLIHPSRLLISLCLYFCLSGCASTKFGITGTAAQQPLCQAPGEPLSAIVLWGPEWRPDQKDVTLREEAAGRGIEQFFSGSTCYSKVELLRLVSGRGASLLSNQEARALAADYQPMPNRALIIKIRELGPILHLRSAPIFVEGGTEVVLEIRVVDVSTGESLADFRAHWQNSGAFVIKGVATLEQDMRSALQAAILPASVIADPGAY